MPMRRWSVCGVLLLLMTSFLLKARQVDAKNQEAATPSGHAARIRPGYVGSDACTLCHQDLVNKFSTNPHTKMALMHSGEGVTCENCNGPGKRISTRAATSRKSSALPR